MRLFRVLHTPILLLYVSLACISFRSAVCDENAPTVVDAVKPQYVKLDMWPDCRIEKWLTDPAELPHPRYKDIPGFHPLCAVVRPNTGGKLTFKIYVAGHLDTGTPRC